MEIVKSSRGGDMLLYQGHSYVKKKVKNGSIRWACTKSRSQACPGAITTDDVQIANPRGQKAHNHTASDSKVEAVKCRSELRTASQSNNAVGTSALLATALQTLSPGALAYVATVDAIKRDVQRQKAKH